MTVKLLGTAGDTQPECLCFVVHRNLKLKAACCFIALLPLISISTESICSFEMCNMNSLLLHRETFPLVLINTVAHSKPHHAVQEPRGQNFVAPGLFQRRHLLLALEHLSNLEGKKCVIVFLH